MRRFLAILLCKLSRWLLALMHRGSSFPGKLALKIYPEVLASINYPKEVIAVTGSNGKTSTTEIIYHTLINAHKKVVYNSEGSNQIDGAACLILTNCDFKGNFKEDVLLLEVDERYCQYIFKFFAPTYFIITNIYRDQLTRNGNPEFVLKQIKKGIRDETTLILNGDDPFLVALAKELTNKVIYYGIENNSQALKDSNSIYNDSYYCPICHQPMSYDYYLFAQMGGYHCDNCGFSRPEIAYKASEVDYENCSFTINNDYKIALAQNSFHRIYNCLPCFALAMQLGIEPPAACESMNNYFLTNGRIKQFALGDKKGTLLISKHENSIAYNQNIQAIIDSKQEASVIIVVDSISRKYFTSDTSWLWDVNFELLQAENIKQVILSGAYSPDLALRMEFAGIQEKIVVRKKIKTAAMYARFKAPGHLYLLTCFSDEMKFLQEVNVA